VVAGGIEEYDTQSLRRDVAGAHAIRATLKLECEMNRVGEAGQYRYDKQESAGGERAIEELLIQSHPESDSGWQPNAQVQLQASQIKARGDAARHP